MSEELAMQKQNSEHDLDASSKWWRDNAFQEMGYRFTDKNLASQATWEQVRQSGEADILAAIALTNFRRGADLSALEIGCGIGRLTANLAPMFGTIEAYDISEEMIDEARRICTDRNVLFGKTDGKTLLAGETEKFDAVFSYEVFHHLGWTTIEQYVGDSFRLLKRGGQLVIQMNAESPKLFTRASKSFRNTLHFFGVPHWRGWPTNRNFGRRHHSESAILALFQEIGFTDVKRLGSNPKQYWFLGSKPYS